MPPRRAQAPGTRLMPVLALLPLLLGAGPQGGCLASPVPAAPLSAPGPCASQPCQNGGVCTPRSVAGQEHPAADAEPGYSCTCPAGVSGTDCQVSGPYSRPETRNLSPAAGSPVLQILTSFCYFRKGIRRCRPGVHPSSAARLSTSVTWQCQLGLLGRVLCSRARQSPHRVPGTRGSIYHQPSSGAPLRGCPG